MREVLLAKLGEMVLKGQNKNTFQDILLKNIRRNLKNVGNFTCSHAQSTIYIVPNEENADIDTAETILRKIFGIVAVCRCGVCEKEIDAISEKIDEYLGDELTRARTFKVEAKRADKTFPLKSPEICSNLGEYILEKYPHLEVDVHNPDITINCEIRDTSAYVHGGKKPGAGGLPVGTGGRAMLMLSGGIDSPVAGFMTAKRGVVLSAVHFSSPPYTSPQSLDKVVTLCRVLTPFCGKILFYNVPFTALQEGISRCCKEEFSTVIMRRLMVKIAEKLAVFDGAQALVTGESLGQVASQTMSALACTDAAAKMLILRPLIGMDKSEIVEISRKIETYATSTLPFEDCCTVFTPKRPRTKPVISDVLREEGNFPYAEILEKAISETLCAVVSAEGELHWKKPFTAGGWKTGEKC